MNLLGRIDYRIEMWQAKLRVTRSYLRQVEGRHIEQFCKMMDNYNYDQKWAKSETLSTDRQGLYRSTLKVPNRVQLF
jgi:hypothetical protein